MTERELLDHLLKVQAECLVLRADEKDEQFSRCADALGEARATIAGLLGELKMLREEIACMPREMFND